MVTVVSFMDKASNNLSIAVISLDFPETFINLTGIKLDLIKI